MAEVNKRERMAIRPAKKKWLNLAAVFLLSLLVLAGLFSAAVAGSKLIYADKFYPSVSIDGLNVGAR